MRLIILENEYVLCHDVYRVKMITGEEFLVDFKPSYDTRNCWTIKKTDSIAQMRSLLEKYYADDAPLVVYGKNNSLKKKLKNQDYVVNGNDTKTKIVYSGISTYEKVGDHNSFTTVKLIIVAHIGCGFLSGKFRTKYVMVEEKK